MSKYYIKCTAKKDIPTLCSSIKEGEVIYYYRRGSSNKMRRDVHPYRFISEYSIYMPFTVQEKYATRWMKRSSVECICNAINNIGEFNAEIIYEEDPNYIKMWKKAKSTMFSNNKQAFLIKTLNNDFTFTDTVLKDHYYIETFDLDHLKKEE